jgi:MFS transporter, DHA2 family, triacylglyceride efflux pump
MTGVQPDLGAPGRRRLAAGAAGAAVLLAALDAYVVVTILVAIVEDLGVPLNHLERATPIVTGYLLGYVAAMPLLGQLSDRLGRLPVLTACLLAFGAGSAVSAAAPSLPVLIAGRLVQGAAGGALLPVTFAVVADSWEERSRPVPIGIVGGLQELGSVLGPLWGAALAALIGWRGLFWVNVPLAAAGAFAVRRALPHTPPRRDVRVDVVGAALLAVGLALVIVALYNPDPSKATLPRWGPAGLVAGAVAVAVFAVWERRSPARLLDLRGPGSGVVAVAVGVSFLTGVALMATLVDVPLVAQTLLGKSSTGGALVLARFLGALSAGAVAGGLIARRAGERPVAVAGMLVAAQGFRLVAGWPPGVLAAHHRLGPLALPRLDTDLVLAGFGLGLVIAPLVASALRFSSVGQHGSVAAAVVVARMMGMLIGIGVLAAWGLHRFRQLTAHLIPPLPVGLGEEAFARQMAAYQRAVEAALRAEYREIFLITAVVCVAGAALSLGLRRGSRAGEPLLVPSA